MPAHSVLSHSKLFDLARPHSMTLHSLCSATLSDSHLFWLKGIQFMQRPLLGIFLKSFFPSGLYFNNYKSSTSSCVLYSHFCVKESSKNSGLTIFLPLFECVGLRRVRTENKWMIRTVYNTCNCTQFHTYRIKVSEICQKNSYIYIR